MRGAQKGAPPDSLAAWKELEHAEENEGWKPSFEDLRDPQRAELVDVLFREQAGCCVYCGRRLKREDYGRRSHIEHFRPRSSYPSLALEHDNLFVSCGPEKHESGMASTTCGHRKGKGFDEERHIDPKDYPAARYFRFRSNGEIAGVGSSGAQAMLDLLNLNDPELVVDRRTILDGVEQVLVDDDPEDALYFWRELDGDGYEPGFSYVVRQFYKAA